jgi:four helix bundle protein
MEIFRLSKSWPLDERYSLTDQIRRSSRSVCANIAEAWRKRRYPNHFVSKLTDADGEAAETQNWLRFAVECAYLSSEKSAELWKAYENISGGLVSMMGDTDRWCGPQNTVRETGAEYLFKTTDDL